MKIYNYNKDDLKQLYVELSNRSPEGEKDIEKSVSEILANVKERGDEAVIEYSKRFAKTDLTPSTIEVTKQLDEALNSIDKNMLRIIEKAASNIREFHEKQKDRCYKKSRCTANECHRIIHFYNPEYHK